MAGRNVTRHVQKRAGNVRESSKTVPEPCRKTCRTRAEHVQNTYETRAGMREGLTSPEPELQTRPRPGAGSPRPGE